jgi:hypothetical protein
MTPEQYTDEFIKAETQSTELSMYSSVSYFLCKYSTMFGTQPELKYLAQVKARVFDEILRRRKEEPESCCSRCTQPTSPIHLFEYYDGKLCYSCLQTIQPVIYDYKMTHKDWKSLSNQDLLIKAWEFRYGKALL